MPKLPAHVLARVARYNTPEAIAEREEADRLAVAEMVAAQAAVVSTWRTADYRVSSHWTLRGRRWFVVDGTGWRHPMEWSTEEGAERQAAGLRGTRKLMLMLDRPDARLRRNR